MRPPRQDGGENAEPNRRGRRINKDAEREGLPVRAIQTDIESWTIDESYDTIVVIGLLTMFFRHETGAQTLNRPPKTRQTREVGQSSTC